jgi:hypothetical protein
MRWLRSRVHNRIDGAALLFEQLHDRGSVPNVQIVMFVSANVCDQAVPGLFRGSFRAKEFRAHIVVDPNQPRSILSESLYGFGPDQARRACNDDRAHSHEPEKFPGADPFDRLRAGSADALQNSCSFVPAGP